MASCHPKKYPIVIEDISVEKVRRAVPTFSPIAFYQSKHSLATFDDNSDGVI